MAAAFPEKGINTYFVAIKNNTLAGSF